MSESLFCGEEFHTYIFGLERNGIAMEHLDVRLLSLLEDSTLLAQTAVSLLPTQKSNFSVFLGICGVKNAIHKGLWQSMSPLNILSENTLISLKNQKIVSAVGVRNFLFCGKKFLCS